MFSKFFAREGGNVSILFAVVLVPLLLSVGLSVDYSRYVSGQNQLQEIADAVSVGLASSKETDEAKIKADAERIVAGNHTDGIEHVIVVGLESDEDKVDVKLAADLPVTFMALAGYKIMDIQANSIAERAMVGEVEVALVLDNTWSMSEKDGFGVSKIAAVKTAAKDLTKKLLEDSKGSVRIGLVPFADYVNVGTKYRNAAWLSVPADYSVQPAPKVCVEKTTKSVCLKNDPTYACTKIIDGVSEPATCGGACTKSETQTVPAYQSCTGGGSATNYKWFGCVGSRITGLARLTDQLPAVKYPGYVETSQKCLNPIVDLSSVKSDIDKAIDGMIINIGSYKPYTYLPSGMIWGLNMLSPSAPFDLGLGYDLNNLKPRKVAVVMTDGENTLRFSASDGRHTQPSGSATVQAAQLKATNDDTLAICKAMKDQQIEVYTVAFMVDDLAAKTMLEACASDSEHYFDASDTNELLASFSGIADALRVVRLMK